MKHTTFLSVAGYTAKVYRCNTAVVGTGAAGYNAADRLWQLGQQDILIITEERGCGTSRNTGSDKQTYYKLTLSGEKADSVREMAQTIFDGQCTDGDIALCEAALSAQCFLKLVDLGVPFPRNRYGEYVGYKTDHDPRRRATSVGPYTSKEMTEKLESAVIAKGIPIMDKLQVIRILSDGEKVLGLMCLNREAASRDDRFTFVHCKNVIYATGGPAGIYADSVYPQGHFGATGLALEAGVHGKNLTEWQYGLASKNPRWNVSGTYMQALPRMFSCEADGSGEREFLMDFFADPGEMLSKLFLKGYQWPFDVRKVKDGSSVIDILVYMETCKGRRVFLDFRENPVKERFSVGILEPEAREYLEKAGAANLKTPLERLVHMNAPAVSFYRDKDVDLASQPLEIALCAQHNNGGLVIDHWWQTNLKGFFAAGEVAASHGVYRPGGTALNAGQVGSTRAAQYIAACGGGPLPAEFENIALESLEKMGGFADQMLSDCSNVQQMMQYAGECMSRCGGAIRNTEEISAYLTQVEHEINTLPQKLKIASADELSDAFRLRDMLITQKVYLSAMIDYAASGGQSRGSALYTDHEGEKPYGQLSDTFTYKLDNGNLGSMVQEVGYQNGECVFVWRPVRPIPQEDDFFENVWREYRKNGNIN